jgi:glycosyltransferase involved in cell wall biosynthesis
VNVKFLRILISKFSDWSYAEFFHSAHPEYAAIREVLLRHPSHIFTLVGEGTNFEHFKIGNISFNNTRGKTKFDYFLSFIFKFELAIIFRPTVSVCLGTINLVPFGMASVLTRSKFIPVITGEVGYSLKDIPRPFRRIFKSLSKAIFQRSHIILSINSSIKKELGDDYQISPEKVLVYKYKISSMFNPQVPKDLKTMLNPNGPIILTISRVSPEKGLHFLIDALKIVSEEFPNVKVVVKGSSNKKYEMFLKELVKKYGLQPNIAFLGFSPYAEISRYIACADLFVLPSISEGTPVSVLEAMATGIPVVSTRVGGIPELIKDDYNGLLVQPGDTKALAEAIIRILSDKSLANRLSKTALETTHKIQENDFEKILSDALFADKSIS